MKAVFLCFFMAVAAGLAAPSAKLNIKEKSTRVKRSNYQAPYISPCAAASAPVSYYAPHPGYGYPQYGVPNGINQQHYRTTEFGEDNEMLSFSDDGHMHLARYAYPHGQILPPVSSPAIGVFPNANVGGCGVPLLFSCTPHITHGKIAKAHPQYSYGSMEHTAAVHPYRDAEEQAEDENHHDEKLMESEDFPHHETNHVSARS